MPGLTRDAIFPTILGYIDSKRLSDYVTTERPSVVPKEDFPCIVVLSMFKHFCVNSQTIYE